MIGIGYRSVWLPRRSGTGGGCPAAARRRRTGVVPGGDFPGLSPDRTCAQSGNLIDRSTSPSYNFGAPGRTPNRPSTAPVPAPEPRPWLLSVTPSHSGVNPGSHQQSPVRTRFIDTRGARRPTSSCSNRRGPPRITAPILLLIKKIGGKDPRSRPTRRSPSATRPPPDHRSGASGMNPR